MVNSKRAIDARLVIIENSEKDQDVIEFFSKIKAFMGISSDTEVIKACVRKGWEHYYKDIIKKNS